jgi:hypothetical protein
VLCGGRPAPRVNSCSAGLATNKVDASVIFAFHKGEVKRGQIVSRILPLIFQNLTFLFGIGFLAPLVAQILVRTAPSIATTPWPLAIGLVVGGGWGAIAQKTGRWL